MNTTIKKLVRLFLGKTYLQSFFELLYKISIKGMNFGDSETSQSGEEWVLHYVKNKITSRKVIIFDVGANQGQYATLATTIFKDKANIYSFEPGKTTFSILEKNTSAIPNIHRNNIALGKEVSDATLHYDQTGSGLASLYERKLDHININFSQNENVTVTTLDAFCGLQSINKIDFLKMDVEGNELDVLKGAHEMLKSKKITMLQFEFGGANIDSRTYFQDFYLLLENKYVMYRVLQNGLKKINQYSELQEIFTTVNYFAELKN